MFRSRDKKLFKENTRSIKNGRSAWSATNSVEYLWTGASTLRFKQACDFAFILESSGPKSILSGRSMLLRQLPLSACSGQFCVELRAYQQCDGIPVKPSHESYKPGQSSVGPAEVRDMAKIESEQAGKADPACHRDNRS